MSSTSSARSDSSSRPASPLSDLEDDDQQGDMSNPLDTDKEEHCFDKHFSTPIPLSTSSFHFPDPVNPNYMVLSTNFNINNRVNKKVPYPRPNDKRAIWTDHQRLLASQAIVPADPADFAVTVGVLFFGWQTSG